MNQWTEIINEFEKKGINFDAGEPMLKKHVKEMLLKKKTCNADM